MKTKTYNKLKIVYAVLCFLIAAMFVAYAAIFVKYVIPDTFADNGAKYEDSFVYVLFVPLVKIAVTVWGAWFFFMIIVYLLYGITFIKRQSEQKDFSKRKQPLMNSLAYSVVNFIHFIVFFLMEFNQIIEHEHADWFMFLMFGLLPTVLFAASIVIAGIILYAFKKEEKSPLFYKNDKFRLF